MEPKEKTLPLLSPPILSPEWLKDIVEGLDEQMEKIRSMLLSGELEAVQAIQTGLIPKGKIHRYVLFCMTQVVHQVLFEETKKDHDVGLWILKKKEEWCSFEALRTRIEKDFEDYILPAIGKDGDRDGGRRRPEPEGLDCGL